MKDCETKYKIMDTAIELIWQNSYESVGVSEICKEAKVNKGSFYHFFESKEVLAVEALNNHSTQFDPIVEQIFSSSKSPVRQILDYCDLIYKLQKEKKDKLGIVCGCPYTNLGLEQSSQSRLITEHVQKCFAKIKKYFATAIKEAVAVGEIDTVDANKKAEELQTFYIGALTHARIRNSLRPLLDVKRVFLDMLGVAEAKVAKR